MERLGKGGGSYMSEDVRTGIAPTRACDLDINEGFKEIHKGMSGVKNMHKDRQKGFDLMRGAYLNNGQSDTLIHRFGSEHIYFHSEHTLQSRIIYHKTIKLSAMQNSYLLGRMTNLRERDLVASRCTCMRLVKLMPEL